MLRRSQQQFSHKISEYVLSEFSSFDSENRTKFSKNNRIFPKTYLFLSGEEEAGEYLEEIINDPSIVSQRMLNVYRSKDKYRNEKWLREVSENEALLQNTKGLKTLIAQNFSMYRDKTN